MKISLLLVFAVLFISGCVGQTAKVDINNGVVVEKFTADPKDVFDYQTVTFSVDVANVGGTTADDASVKLLGVENAWRQQVGSGTVLEVAKGPFTLKPPNLKDNRPGDSRFFDVTLTAPDLNEGDKATFPVKARAEFSYSTTGSIIVKAVSINQNRILQSKGQNVLDAVKESNSDGPVKFRFVRGPTPLVIDPDEGTTIERDFRFEISNVGAGYPITDNSVGKVGGSSRGNRIILQAPSGIRLKSCDGISGNPDSFSGTLRSDGKVPISCTLSINTADWRTKSEGSVVFSVELNYKYFVESEVSVAVQGTKRGDVSRPAGAPAASGTGATPVPGARPPTVTLSSVTPPARNPSPNDWYNGAAPYNKVSISLTYGAEAGLSKCEYKTPKFSDWVKASDCSGGSTGLAVLVGIGPDSGECTGEGRESCRIEARVTDLNGRTATLSPLLLKTDFTFPVLPDTITGNSTLNISSPSTIPATDLKYSFAASDALSGIQVCNLIVTTPSSLSTNVESLSGTPLSIQLSIGILTTAGAYKLQVECKDFAGNLATKATSPVKMVTVIK